jgi:hypothetical protein
MSEILPFTFHRILNEEQTQELQAATRWFSCAMRRKLTVLNENKCERSLHLMSICD